MDDDAIDISRYLVDRQRGFLPSQDPVDRMPPGFELWDETVDNLSALIVTETLRDRIHQWPRLDTAPLQRRLDLERGMLVLSLVGHAYVWAASTPELRIPHPLAQPWCEIAERLDRPPVISHASLVLHNWRRLNRKLEPSLSNLATQAQVLGGMDESWFYLVTVAIEACGAAALPILAEIASGSTLASSDALVVRLEALAPVVERLTPLLERMRQRCDPYVFYRRVRPFLAGWPEPGVVYEGVWAQARVFAGGSAAQSSLLQAIDAGLGISHTDARSGPFLSEMRKYMPKEHRMFLVALESGNSIRDVACAGDASPHLRRAYERCVRAVETFRKSHYAMVRDYVTVPAESLNEAAIGTGGTAYGKFLTQAIVDTSVD